MSKLTSHYFNYLKVWKDYNAVMTPTRSKKLTLKYLAALLVYLGWVATLQGGEPSKQAPTRVPPFACITTALWAPFNTQVNGKLTGIGIDYWDAICKQLNIPFDCKRVESWSDVLKAIRSGAADVTIATQPTESRKKYAVFTKPYASYPYVIVTRNDIGFIYDVNLLKGKKVVLGRRYTITNIMRKKHPLIAFEEVDSVDTALKRVANGQAFAVIDAFPVLSYQINKHQFSNLKISGSLPETFDSHIMLSKKFAEWLPAINRAIDRITPENKKTINARWIIPFQNVQASKSTVYFLFIFFTLLFLAFLWILRLRKTIGHKEVDLKKLKEVATVDSLTTVYNRHMLSSLLDRQIATSDRYRHLFSLVFFDIDHFKQVNDRYGHDAGDAVLQALARVVSDTIRQSDLFGRWGGDEFMIILPHSTGKQTRRLVDMLDERIRQHTFPVVKNISCSFGITAYGYGDTAEELMKRVDEDLYRAKKNRKPL